MPSFMTGVKEHLYRVKNDYLASQDILPVRQHEIEDQILKQEKDLSLLLLLERDRQR